MKHKKLLIGGISVLTAAAVVAGGFAALRLSRPPVKVVSVAEVSMTDMYWGGGQTYGTVRADNVQNVWLSDTQTVTAMLVEDGQTVQIGDALLTYDTTLDGLKVQRKALEIQEKERSLEKAKKEYNQLCGYKAYAVAWGGAPESRILLSLLAETETEISEPTELTAEATEPTAAPVTEAPTEAPPETSEPVPTEPSSEPTVTTEPEPTDEPPTEETADPNTVTDYRILSGSGTEESPYLCVIAADAPFPYEMVGKFSQQDREIWVVFANTEADQADGLVTSAWGMVFSAEGFALFDANGYVGNPLQPIPPEEPTDDPGGGGGGGWGGGGMSYEERQRLLKEKAEEIRDLDLEIRVAKVELERMQKELGDGTVYAETDGVVRLIGDPETAYLSGEPVLRVSGGGGFYVNAQIDELSLDTVAPGQTVTVNSWMDGMSYEGVVETVTDYPVEDSYGWGGGQSLTYYGFTVFVSEDAMLSEGDYVDISYQSGGGDGGSLYLQLPFVRSENGKYTVFVQDENGRLQRRELVTGRIVDNWCIEVRGGLTTEDNIAFPYGKNVVDGAKTELVSIDALYAEGGIG